MHESLSILRSVISRVRRLADETVIDAKFKDDVLISDYLCQAVPDLYGRLAMDYDAPIYLRFPITISKNTEFYDLPASVAEVHGLCKFDSTGTAQLVFDPRDRLDTRNRGWSLEGTRLRVDRNSGLFGDYELLYIPSPVFFPHYATDGELDSDLQTLTLGDPTLGLLDRREGGYVGSYVRILPSTGPIHERLITSHTWDGSDWIIGLDAPVSGVTAGTVTYEIAPPIDPTMIEALAQLIVYSLALTREKSQTYMLGLERQLRMKLKTLGDRYSNMQARTGKSWNLFIATGAN